MAVELIQDAIVTTVALGAGAVVARRVFGFMTIKDTGHDGCDKCASSPAGDLSSGAATNSAAPGLSPTVHPLIVIRRSTSSRSTSV